MELVSESSAIWLEVATVFTFVFGFSLVRYVLLASRRKDAPAEIPLERQVARPARLSAQARRDRVKFATESRAAVFAAVEAEFLAGRASSALAMWRQVKVLHPTPVETLRVVVEALCCQEPQGLVDEIVEHFRVHEELRCPAIAAVVLGDVGRVGQIGSMEALHSAITRRLGVADTPQMTEAIVGAYAFATDRAEALIEFMARTRAEGQKITVRGHSFALRGLLKNGLLDAALEQSKEMQQQGFIIPSFAISELFRAACDQGRAAELLEETSLQLTADAVVQLLEHCLREADLGLAEHVEQRAIEASLSLCPRAVRALQKLRK